MNIKPKSDKSRIIHKLQQVVTYNKQNQSTNNTPIQSNQSSIKMNIASPKFSLPHLPTSKMGLRRFFSEPSSPTVSTCSSTPSLTSSQPSIKSHQEFLSDFFDCISKHNQTKSNYQITKGLSQFSFKRFSKIQKIVNDRLYSALKIRERDFNLNKQSFIKNLNRLAFGKLHQKLKIVFNILDINSRGVITPQECIFILQHIPSPVFRSKQVKSLSQKQKFDIQRNYQNEIVRVVQKLFTKHKQLSLQKFIQRAQMRTSDVQLYILFYIQDQLNLRRRYVHYTQRYNTRSSPLPSSKPQDCHRVELDSCVSPTSQILFKQLQDRKQIQIAGFMISKMRKDEKIGKHWYQLRGSELYGYDKRDDLHHSQLILLDLSDSVQCIQSSIKLKNSQKVMNIKISTGKSLSQYSFYVLKQSQAKSWIRGINQATRRQRNFEDFYSLQQQLGRGKFASVQLAQPINRQINTEKQQKVAVKTIDKSEMKDDELLSLEYEIACLKTCQHEKIVNMRQVFEMQDKLMIIQDCLTGGSLRQYLDKHQDKLLNQNLIISLVKQLAQGLLYLKQHNIVHRDLKPDNIMIVNDKISSQDYKTIPDIKLIDFGLSTILAPGEKSKDPFGSLDYVAPEVIKTSGHDYQTDVYSLGVILYQLLHLNPPFMTDNERQLVRMITQQQPEYEEQILINYSQDLIKLSKQMLIKNPRKRITIQQIVEALK